MKRFTETSKWRDPWFQGLSHGSKLLFLYLCDNCDNAGFYEINEPELCFHLGIDKGKFEGALKGLARGIKGPFEGWLWVRRFLRHQKNEVINPSNPAHKQIIALLTSQGSRFSSCQEFKEFVAPYKGLLSPIGTGIGKGIGKKRGAGEDTEALKVYGLYPLKVAKPEALKAIRKAIDSFGVQTLLDKTAAYARARNGNLDFVPHPATWFNREMFNDDPATWKPKEHGKNGKPIDPRDLERQTKLDAEFEEAQRKWNEKHGTK